MSLARPSLSIVVDVEGASRSAINETLDAAFAQASTELELLLHGDRSAEILSTQDGRVRLVAADGDPGERARMALVQARGEFAMFLRAGESFVGPQALDPIAGRLTKPELDLLYCDEVVSHGQSDLETVPKPLWSPERLLCQNWLGRAVLVRTATAADACADEPLGSAWEHDLWLRVAGQVREVERIAVPLMQGPRRPAVESAATADVVRRELLRRGRDAGTLPGPVEGTCRVVHELAPDVGVAVIVPTDGSRGIAWGERRTFAVDAVRSVLAHTLHERLEVVVVHTSSTSATVLAALLAIGEQVRLVRHEGPFDYPTLANIGVLSTVADRVVLLDQHSLVESDQFVERLVASLDDDGVGLSGPRTLGLSGRLVDGGVAMYQRRVEPMFQGHDPDEPGPGGLFGLTREVSGLSGGCLAFRREIFQELGGLNEQLPTAWCSDLSFKARHAGLRRLWVDGATARTVTPPHQAGTLTRPESAALRNRWSGPEVDEYVPTFGAWRVERDRRSGAS